MGEEERFEFHQLPRDVESEVRAQAKDTAELFEKWGLSGRMKFATFLYNSHFQSYQKDSFTLDFFQSPVVNSVLTMPSSSGHPAPLSMASAVTSVEVDQVPCTLLSMNFFDRLKSSGIVRENGAIVKCFDEMYDNFLVSDELRKVLIIKDSENYDVFGAKDRSEFLFKVFTHITLGGPVNQYEDEVKPYLSTGKLLYKTLLTVVKKPSTSKLSIASTVLDVKAKVDEDVVFPWRQVDGGHPQSFCYLIIDNIKRQVTAWYHTWH
ncbi:Cilia- and flagella-associated protein 300 [Geodia barretti]|uniref:Cilia- and flagella-associated protein 300 n=1 Tax=Geodia barretti TaxID=519541 RepID=A0AA35RZT7_GEOBA|nr:Cilia- and flagella-associated protein 300 [Geodia barretti]